MSAPELEGHAISRLLDEAPVLVQLAERFAQQGKQLYLVGGAVRNLALRDVRDDSASANPANPTSSEGATESAPTPTQTPDYDLTTDARPDQTKAILQPIADHLWLQGERFGTIGCIIAGCALEITTHRQEAYDPVSRKPAVVFGDDITTDLSRRDFTINAMAVQLPAGTLLDPYGGLADLHHRRLATPLAAELSFRDDPLRMLRAARFTAQFALTPAADLLAAMREMAPRLDIVSAERIYAELVRLLRLPDPAAGLDMLVAAGLDELIFAEPELLSAQRIQLLSRLEPKVEVRASVLLSGSQNLGELLSRLRFPRRERQSILSLVQLSHQLLEILAAAGERQSDTNQVLEIDQDSDSDSDSDSDTDTDTLPQLRSWILRVNGTATETDDADETETTDEPASGASGFQADLLAVSNALAELRGLGNRFDSFLNIYQRERSLNVPISGGEAIQILEIAPGPQVSRALEFLAAQTATSGQLTRADCETLLQQWIEPQSKTLD